MGKKDKAIYAPGELSRVRDKLGVKDHEEAKRMAELLGGEIGTERSQAQDSFITSRKTRRETVELVVGRRKSRKRPGRKIELTELDKNGNTIAHSEPYDEWDDEMYLEDDPSIPLKLGYWERIKMDQYASQVMFEIKNPVQVFASIISFFKKPVDYVNSGFVTKRMNEYYNKIEKLVMAARTLFPVSNKKRNYQLKRVSPFVYRVLDTMRNWDIERISKEIAKMQAHPRSVKVSDFSGILQDVYKPLFVLSDLNLEDIKIAFKLVYKILYLESPMDAKEKYQDIIRSIISSLMDVRRDVQFGMYPLLMKLISDRFISYDQFFIERRNRFMVFLEVSDADQLNAVDLIAQQVENINTETLQQNMTEEGIEEMEPSEETPVEEDPNDPKVIARKAKEESEKAEQKALEQGLAVLEALFPKAGWEKCGEGSSDFYPYFANVYSLRGGYELISPTDPLQIISVLMHILDDMIIGLRYVHFGTVIGMDGSTVKLNDELGEIINNWRMYIDESFSKEYLPRLTNYCRMLENSPEARQSVYARKIMNELNWIKRLCFLPYCKFESIGPPPIQKKDAISISAKIRKLRQFFTSVAVGIERGMRAGGAEEKAQCDGINNPWEAYNFPVPNPSSKRMGMLFPPEKRNNASLVFFFLSTVTVLDFIINNENSWAYESRPSTLFRSIRNEGIIPLFGVDNKLNADQIFLDSLKKKV